MDSNHRRHRQQIYSLPHLATLVTTLVFLSLLSDSNQRPRDYTSRALANGAKDAFLCSRLCYCSMTVLKTAAKLSIIF